MATVASVRSVGRNDAAITAASDDDLQFALDEAALHVASSSWGDRYDMGHALLAAHLFTDGSRGATTSPIKGPIVQESLGPASRTYAQSLVKVQDDVLNLNGTTYGRRYMALRQQLVISPLGIYEAT